MADTKRFAPSLRSIDNRGTGDRGTDTVNVVSGQTYWAGGFFNPEVGSNGANGYAANAAVKGIIEDIETNVGNGMFLSVWDRNIVSTPGTVTKATNTAPAKYVAAAGDANGVTRIVYRRLNHGDKVVVYLGESGVLTKRGTTASSDTLNHFIEPDPNASYTFQESSANSSNTGKNFTIVGRPAKSQYQVIATLINPNGNNV